MGLVLIYNVNNFASLRCRENKIWLLFSCVSHKYSKSITILFSGLSYIINHKNRQKRRQDVLLLCVVFLQDVTDYGSSKFSCPLQILVKFDFFAISLNLCSANNLHKLWKTYNMDQRLQIYWLIDK